LLITIGCIISFIPKQGFSQVDHIQVLIGETETTVINYLDSLNRLKPNSHFKIEKDVTDFGDLMLHCDFPLNDENEEFFKCNTLIFVFKRLHPGEERCTTESVLGNATYAFSQLNYIKDNFKFVSDNTWEKNFSEQGKIVASFKKETQSPFFGIEYELKEK
jgi:hypothetical protein